MKMETPLSEVKQIWTKLNLRGQKGSFSQSVQKDLKHCTAWPVEIMLSSRSANLCPGSGQSHAWSLEGEWLRSSLTGKGLVFTVDSEENIIQHWALIVKKANCTLAYSRRCMASRLTEAIISLCPVLERPHLDPGSSYRLSSSRKILRNWRQFCRGLRRCSIWLSEVEMRVWVSLFL